MRARSRACARSVCARACIIETSVRVRESWCLEVRVKARARQVVCVRIPDSVYIYIVYTPGRVCVKAFERPNVFTFGAQQSAEWSA